MLALLIISVIVFLGIPLLIITSLMKSQEKQLDMDLQNITYDATNSQGPVKLPNKPSVKKPRPKKNTAKEQRPTKKQPSAKKRRGAVTANQKKKPVATVKQQPVESKVSVIERVSKHMNTIKSKLSELQVETVQFFRKRKSGTVNTVVTLRKKIPGYVYPSKEEMLRDQQLTREKERVKIEVEDSKRQEHSNEAKTP